MGCRFLGLQIDGNKLSAVFAVRPSALVSESPGQCETPSMLRVKF